MTAKKLIELRKLAEQAVTDMEDEPMKITAFTVILAYLFRDANEKKPAK